MLLLLLRAKIVVKSEGKVVFTEEKKFKPMDVYKTSVAVNQNADYEVTVEGMDLKYSPSKRVVLSRPFVFINAKGSFTPEHLFTRKAWNLKKEEIIIQAEKLFKRCLQKDPLYIDAYAALTELYYRSMQYDSALYYANSALQLDTYHPAANYFAGITYLAIGELEDAIESLGWAARSPEYRSTAYARMADN